jgi:hypothetical protein
VKVCMMVWPIDLQYVCTYAPGVNCGGLSSTCSLPCTAPVQRDYAVHMINYTFDSAPRLQSTVLIPNFDLSYSRSGLP